MTSTWPEMQRALRDLESRDPRPLLGHPDPRSPDEGPPYALWLRAWAVDDAAELHRRFGADVSLTVGALPYPPDPAVPPPNRRRPEPRALADDAGITVALEQPLVVRSGYSARPNVLVANHSDQDITIRTNGQLQASVIRPDGTDVGRYIGAQRMPGKRFDVPAGGSAIIPVLVGTDGLAVDIGYAVPPGRWSLQVELDLQDGRRLRSASLPFDVVE